MHRIGTAPGLVAGSSWIITFEFSPFGFLDFRPVGPFVIGDWYQSGIVKSATYTTQDSLLMTLAADYPKKPNYAERPDRDKPALLIRCRSVDPSLQPLGPVGAPFDFTLPRETLEKYRKRHPRPPHRTSRDRP